MAEPLRTENEDNFGYEEEWDTARGIKNVTARGKAQNEAAFDDTLQEGPLERAYQKEKSVPARVKKRRAQHAEKKLRAVSNDEEFSSEVGGARGNAAHLRMLATHTSIEGSQKVLIKKALKIASFSKWMSLGAVWTAFMWQFMFAVISLIGYGTKAMVTNFQTNTVPGKIIGFFVDISKYFPGDTIGAAFWGLGVLLSFGVFFGFLLYYYLATEIKPFKTTTSTFITFVCLALNIIPITNLLPFLALWVVYMNSTAFFNSGE